MVADGLSIINADFSSTSFRVSRASIGAHNFLGNHIAYPSQGQDGRQLPARDEGHGPDRRAGPGGRRAAGLAQLRDPAHGRAGHQVRPPGERRRAAPPPRRQEPAQPRHHRAVPAGAVVPRLRAHPARLAASSTSTRPFGALAIALAGRRHPPVHRCSTSCWSNGPSRGSGRCSRRTARSTTATSGGTNASGSCHAGGAHALLQRHPVQERDLAAAGRPDRQAGLRRRLRA